MKEKESKIIEFPEQKVFNFYLQDFDLKPEDLKDKIILDVGSGMTLEFVEYCLKNGLTDKIFAIDHWPFGHEIEMFTTDEDLEYAEFVPAEEARHLKSKKHYIQAEGEKLPIKKDFKFDLILMRATLGQEHDTTKLINEGVSYLKQGGELRIAPVWERGPDIKKLKKAIEAAKNLGIEAEWKEGIVKRDTKEEALLLIIRKL